MTAEYFRVCAERRDYKGDRYFKVDWQSDKVVQVCIHHGEIKAGRTNSFGVTLIHRLTFTSNYLAYRYVKHCSKEEYEKKFNEVVKMLI
jgi:hypothetical protein